MTREHYEKKKRDPLYRAAVAFIDKLTEQGIPLSVFWTNDWHSNTAPSVYMDLRGHEKPDGTRSWLNADMRRCQRLDAQGIAQALKWYRKMTVLTI